MEVESTSVKNEKSIGTPPHQNSRKRRRNICLAVMAVILGLALLLLILGLTVFKAKRPVTTVNAVSLKDLQFSLDIPRIRVHLNITLDVNLSIKNRNKVGFKYTNSSTSLKYRGEVVGEVPVPAGKISGDQTVPMNLTVTVLADRLLSNSQVYSDVLSGTLPFSTFTRIRGYVRIIGIKIHLVSYTTCDVNINISSRSVANQTCHYKTKL